MRFLSSTFSFAVLAAVLLTGCDAVSSDAASFETALGTTADAHESNNRANLTGMATGTAIVNYVAGREAWRSTVNLEGDLADGTYGYYVAGGPSGDAGQLVCTFTVDGNGRMGCSADTDLPGFARAEIRDSEDNVVASGMFVRRGGNRE